MRLYSKKNKEDLFDIFDVDINLPKFKWGTQPGNAWGNDYPTKVIDINFDTKLSADTIITARATFRYQSYKYLTL